MDSIKNRKRHPIGTRVKLAYAKLSTREGTVVEWDEDEFGKSLDAVSVLWDGNEFPYSGYMPSELKEIK